MQNKKIWMMLIFASALLLQVYSADRPAAPVVNQDQMKKMQEQMMENLKKQDPKMYEQMKASQEAQAKMIQIITDFRAGKISYETAKNQLRPLIAEQLKVRAANVDNEITQMEMRISQLKKLKTNFSEVVDKIVDVRLGKAMPDPTMGF